ncbi:CHAT domain-containing protein [candidate division KSB1 bacterium]|nr:CHAT domain-containing protein [candidate division KSB1 bacterium]
MKYEFKKSFNRRLLLLLFIALPQITIASDNLNHSLADTSLIVSNIDKGLAFFNSEKYDSSIVYYNVAINLALQTIRSGNNEVVFWKLYAKSCNGLVENYIKISNFDEAESTVNSAIEAVPSRLLEEYFDFAELRQNLGIIYYYKRDIQRSIENLFRALEIKKEIGDPDQPQVANTLDWLAHLHRYKSDHRNGTRYALEALRIREKTLDPDDPKLASSYYSIAISYYNSGEFEKALSYLEKSRSIKLKIFGENHPQVAYIYRSFGLIYITLGDYDQALEILQQSLEILSQHFKNDHYQIARTFQSLGRTYYLKQEYDKAYDYYKKALDIFVNTFGMENKEVATMYDYIGAVHFRKGNFTQAIEFYKKSIAIKIGLMGKLQDGVAVSYHNLGMVYEEMGDYDKALAYCDSTLIIEKQVLDKHSANLAETYYNYANIYLKKEDFKNALSYIQNATAVLVHDFNNEDLLVNPELQNISSPPLLLKILNIKGDILASYHSAFPDSLHLLKQALATYQLAYELIDLTRVKYYFEGSKEFLAENTAHIYENATNASLELYNETGERSYLENIFTISEKAKAGILMSLLQESKAKQFAGLPDSLVEKEKYLRQECSSLAIEIQKALANANEADSLETQQLNATYFKYSNTHQKIIKRIESSYPNYYNLKFRTQPVTISDVQSTLDHDTALIEYFMSDSTLTITFISDELWDVVTCHLDTNFQSQLSEFLVSIKKVDPAMFVDTSSHLYEILISPIESYLQAKSKLVIIPHGFLNKIPFEALCPTVDANSHPTDFNKLSYLVKKFEISYHYSATLFQNIQAESYRRHVAALSTSFVGFAPVFSDADTSGALLVNNEQPINAMIADDELRSLYINGSKFRELKNSETEIKEIVSQYNKRKKKAVGYLHNSATEKEFKNSTGQFEIIHVATHGIINEGRPQLSGIIFSQPTDSTDTEDGILFSGETYNLDLNADLVVLSSCESGVGKLVRGEGVMALTRGFLYSGALNIIVSLWKVSDKQTSELMINFYKDTLQDHSYSKALRVAKLKMIENKATAFPKSWSSFVLIGR